MHTEEKHNDIDELISLYISGTLDEPSFARLKQWSLESEVNRVYVRIRLEVWFSSGVSGDGASFNKNEAFDLFRQRIAKAEEKQKQVRRFSWKVLYRVAAVILILFFYSQIITSNTLCFNLIYIMLVLGLVHNYTINENKK